RRRNEATGRSGENGHAVTLDGTCPGRKRRYDRIAGEKARREGTQGAGGYSDGRPLRRDRGSSGCFPVDFQAEFSDDSSRPIQEWRILLERAYDERSRRCLRLLFSVVRVERRPGYGYGTGRNLSCLRKRWTPVGRHDDYTQGSANASHVDLLC